MGQRNTQYPHQQMHDLPLEQGLSASGNTAEPVFLYVDYPERGTLYGSQYSFQNVHAAPNLGLSASTPPNFYNPCMFPSSSLRNFPPQYNVSSGHLPSAGSMSELGRNDQSGDSIIGFGKRKNAQLPPGNQHIVNCSAHSGSLTSVSFDPGTNLVSSTNFEHSEHQESGNVQSTEGSHRSVRSRSSVVCRWPEPAYFPHPQPNYLLQATHMGHSLHPATNVRMAHFGVENNIGGEACSNWNYNNSATYLHGRYLQSGAFELTNMGVPAFLDASSSANATVLFNPAPLPNFYPHPPPVQTIPLQCYSHPVQMQIPYLHPLNNVLPIDVNSSHVPNPDSRFPNFPSNAEHIYRLRQLHHAAPDFGRGGVRILSPEDAAVMDRFYGVRNAIDRHQDLRMDTDGMSYEELLALGEQIGSVKTGLTEEYLVDHLKTSMYSSQKTTSRFSQHTEACIICQVEYDEDEILGTLDCGHNYHGECIKRWLLEKNLCPICKKTAFETDTNKG